jgi:formamidopyrimidine-DNA glycosylase
MPELPDVELYRSALTARVSGQPIEAVRVGNPFVVRTYDPPIAAIAGRTVRGIRRLGKRLVFELDGTLFIVVHLVEGEAALSAHDPGGLEIFDADLAAFAARLVVDNHTLKRALTDPHIFSGIGNAYSDEILHAARLSPMKLTASLTDEEKERLFHATRDTLQMWVERLAQESGEDFPEKVTAFRPEMAVHGKYGKACPVCGEPVQRIVYAHNEANYCARCQTGGRLLSDRALSRLLGRDWPKTLEEMELRKRR